MGRPRQQVHLLRFTHFGTVIAARTVEHKHELFGRARAHLLSECLQLYREELDIDCCCQMPHGASRGGMDEANAVAPRRAMLDRSDRSSGALAGDGGQSPDLAQQWLESDSVFVNRPQLDARLGEGGGHRAQQRAQSLLALRLGLQISVDVPRAGQTQAALRRRRYAPPS